MKTLTLAIVIAVILAAANVTFAQDVQVIRVVPSQPIISYAPIKPYGLNLQPANVPVREAAPITFDAGAQGGGPVVIDNPYFPAPDNTPKRETVCERIGRFIFEWTNALRLL